MAYTPEQLAIVCPKCRAAVGGKCLTPSLWGQAFIEDPHPERVQEAEKNASA
jgi:hypothetical protein